MATQITEYSKTDAALAELSQRYKGVVFEVATKEGMQAARLARAELRGYRVDLEKTRVEIKAPALERCNLIDSEARRIKTQLESLEDPIDQQIKLEEERKEREKAEREAKEAARVAAIHEEIQSVHALASSAVGLRAAEVKELLDGLRDQKWKNDPAEFAATAEDAKTRTIAALEQLHAGAVAKEREAAEEAARIKAEREELARLRTEQEARARDEQARLAAEAKQRAEEARKIAEEQAAARAKLEAEERASRERIEREERAARLAREEADKKAQKEREAAAAKVAEEERRNREERERIEAERREVERQAAELADGRTMLELFCARFGKRKEFAHIAKGIRAFLDAEQVSA